MDINEEVSLSDYNKEWRFQFEKEKESLESFFPDVHIEHIGSTSIAGMRAKPIIDIILGVDSYPPSDEIPTQLEHLGYYNFGENDKANGRLYFIKRGVINYNVHVIKYMGILWNNNVRFRDYLNENSDAAEKYLQLKMNIIAKGANTLLEYSKEKEKLISEIIQKMNTGL